MRYRLVVIEIGTQKETKTKYVYEATDTELREAEKRRNQLDWFLARRHGDGVYRVQLKAEAEPKYHVYDDIGLFQGTFSKKQATKLLEEHDNWTWSEVTK